MTIKIRFTAEGTVAREILYGGDRWYRLGNHGWWETADHTGPWARTDRGLIPQEIKDAIVAEHAKYY